MPKMSMGRLWGLMGVIMFIAVVLALLRTTLMTAWNTFVTSADTGIALLASFVILAILVYFAFGHEASE